MSKYLDLEAMSASKIQGDIITQTLDTLNSGQYSGSGTKCSGSNKISDTYNLSKSVLSSVYQGKGAVISAKS